MRSRCDMGSPGCKVARFSPCRLFHDSSGCIGGCSDFLVSLRRGVNKASRPKTGLCWASGSRCQGKWKPTLLAKPLHLVFKMDLNSVISPPASKQWEGRHWTCCSFAREDPMVDPFGSNGPQFVLTWIEVLNRCPERPSLASSAVRWPEWKRGKRTPCLEWCSGCGFREWPRKGRGFGTGSEAVEVA